MGTLSEALQLAGPAAATPTPTGTLGAALQEASRPSKGDSESTKNPDGSLNLTIRDLGSPAEGLKGIADASAALGSNMILQPIAGLAGAARTAYGAATGEENPAAAGSNWIKNVQDAAYQPQTETGKAILSLPGLFKDAAAKGINVFAPGWGETVTNPGKSLGDYVYEKSGSPVLGAAAAAVPTALSMVLPAAKALRGEEAAGVAADVPAGVPAPVASLQAPRELAGGGAAAANSNPYPALAAEESSRGQFPVVKLSKTAEDAAPAEQASRAQIVRDLNGWEPGDGRIRPGVVTGNADTLASETLQANAANPDARGQLLRNAIADEQSALSNFAAQRVEATGANPRFINDYQRGEFLNSTMYGDDGIKGAIDAAKKDLYDQAAKRVGPNPMPEGLGRLKSLLEDPAAQAELEGKGQGSLYPAIAKLVNLYKTTGFGNAAAGSVGAAQALRQSLNRMWSPANKYAIGNAVKALDQDVGAAGGADLYQQANAIHAAEKTMFGSRGIKTLFGDVDPNGVQTATSFDAIPGKLNSMPYDQWRHIHDTFDAVANGRLPGGIQVSPELQEAAQQAKNEMAGSLVRDVQQAGGNNVGNWNANAANKVLNSHDQKLQLALPPDEMNKMHTLNMAGQIMPPRFSYEGAALQLRRAGENDVGVLEKHLPKLGAMAGAATRLPGLDLLGMKAGEKGAGLLLDRRKLAAAKELDAQMERNAKLQ
jgi:hypothetical protein